MDKLAKIEPTQQALARAKNPGEARKISKLARAAYEVVKREKESSTDARRYYFLMLDAQKRAGELLLQMEKNHGRLLRGRVARPRGNAITLAEMGISKYESAQWQRIARLPEQEWRKYKLRRWDLIKMKGGGCDMQLLGVQGDCDGPLRKTPICPRHWNMAMEYALEQGLL